MAEYKYFLPDHGMNEIDAYQIKSDLGEDVTDLIVKDCAKDYHDNHDGWEAMWPKRFSVFIAGEWKTFWVDREHEPYFVIVP